MSRSHRTSRALLPREAGEASNPPFLHCGERSRARRPVSLPLSVGLGFARRRSSGRLTALGRHTAANVRPSASSRAVSLVKDLPALDRHIDVLPPSSMAWQTRPVIPAA